MRKKIYLIFALLLFAGIFRTYSQCLMLETSLNDRVQASSAIFEGKVISTTSFWNNQHTSIFTSNIIEIYKVFKGDITAEKVEIITPGGVVETNMEVVTPSLELSVGETGIFMVQKNTVENSPSTVIPENLKFESSYSASQGFVKYDLVEKTATDVFHSYKNIENEVYTPIMIQTGKNYKVIKSFDINSTGCHKADKSVLAPSISGFSPTTITAGTLSVLTINGSGFGTNSGSAKVEFKNADDGGASWIPNNTGTGSVVSWSASQIQVIVPKRAGTGQIRVTDNAGSAVTSTGTLTVTYAQLTALSSNVENRMRMANQNAAGGYTLAYNTGFNSNAPAVAAFERAWNTWRCSSYANYKKAATTTSLSCNAADGTNVVTFDASCQISSPFIGMTNTYYTACSSGGTFYWILSEFDIRFSAGTSNWNYGPGATSGNKLDFESVCLHEIGHALLEGHLIAPGELMHWSIDQNHDNRILNSSTDLANAVEIVNRSTTSYPCGATGMIKLNSGNCTLAAGNEKQQFSDNVSFYPNPFESYTVLHTSNLAGKQILLVIYDLLGNKVKQAEINESEYTLTRDKLHSGMYFYQIRDKENVVSSGKLIITD